MCTRISILLNKIFNVLPVCNKLPTFKVLHPCIKRKQIHYNRFWGFFSRFVQLWEQLVSVLLTISQN